MILKKVSRGNKSALLAFSALALFWTDLALARVTASACNNCTEAQYAATATANASSAGSVAPQHVYDLTKGNLRKYQITRELVYGGYAYYADEVAPDSTVLEAFQVYDRALADNNYQPSIFNTRHQTDGGFPEANVSTVDVATIEAYQYEIGTWIVSTNNSANNSPLLNDANLTAKGLVAALTSLLLKQNPLALMTTVDMKDGGLLTYVFNGSQKYSQITEARDANHNRIPLVISQVPGTYIFKDGTGDKFAGFIHNNYPDVGFNNYQVCKNGTLACTSSTVGGTTVRSCTWSSCGGVP